MNSVCTGRTLAKLNRLVLAMLTAVAVAAPCGAQEPFASTSVGLAIDPSFASALSTERGFFFLDGEYVLPPYDFRVTDHGVFLNGRDITELVPQEQPRARRHWDRSSTPPFDRPARELQDDLHNGSVIVLFAGQPATSLYGTTEKYRFFELLLARDDRKTLVNEFCTDFPDVCDQTLWRSWLGEFTAPDELLVRARACIDTIDNIAEANLARNRAVQRLNSFAFPLTTLGMVLSVLSFGHLLRHQPTVKLPGPIDASEDASLLVRRSLVLVLALSTLDLVWTILAAQAGQMRELNPLGSQLVHSPGALITFKVAITCAAAGLLFRLRRYRRAQEGAWWACLICTILTVRWLVLNSLFVT